MKIFIGCEDIASVLSGLAEGFKDLGHTVNTLVFTRNKFYPDADYDTVATEMFASNFPDLLSTHFPSVRNRVNNALMNFSLGQKTHSWIEGFDLFVFIWRAWTPDEWRLFQKIKEAKKKIICIHLGSDVRHLTAYEQEFKVDTTSWESYFHSDDLNAKIQKIRIHETWADAIFSVPDQAGLAIRPYNHIFIPISRKKNIKFMVPAREKPVIIHAPSRAGAKGTRIIIETMDRLKTEGYAFEFRLLENMLNPELMEELTRADILLDEVFLHGPGVLGAEAMLAGCAVVTRTMENHKDVFDPPVLNVSPNTLYEKVKILLDNSALRTQLAEKGRIFADRYNHPAFVAGDVLQKLNREGCDYQPVFYMEQYKLPDNVQLTRKNLTLSSQLTRQYYRGNSNNFDRARAAGLI